MAVVTLRRTRLHGYAKMVPTENPDLASFKSVKPDDPFARRNVDATGGPAMIEVAVPGVPGAFKRERLEPRAENVECWISVFQRIAVYRSEDGRYEISIELSRGETAPDTISVDVSV